VGKQAYSGPLRHLLGNSPS